MAHVLCFGDPFLYYGAASCEDHDVRLSGPAVPAPPPSHESGAEPWDGPYGPSIETWNDVTHPPGGVLSYAATFGGNPTSSWMFGSEVPNGWYAVKIRKRKR